MDEIVKAALRKWPNVPHCHGWLALDARGDWYMRDDRVRRAGPFPQVKGSRILHDKLRDFIGRNYLSDPSGCWYFQNGPQRVYVALEAAPWVWRVHWQRSAANVVSHTGRDPGPVQHAWLDENGRLFLACAIGIGIVHPMDIGDAAEAVERGLWSPEPVQFAQLPALGGYVIDPQP